MSKYTRIRGFRSCEYLYILAVKYDIQTVMFSYFNNKNEPICF